MFVQLLRLIHLETGFDTWQRIRRRLGHTVTGGAEDRSAYLGSIMGRDR